MIVVSNATPLISLSKIDAFLQLQSLYGTIYISAEVYQEVAVAGAHLPGACESTNAPWIQVKHIQRPSDLAIAQRRFGLGAGELSTLILARETEAELVIIDDLRARKTCAKTGFSSSGHHCNIGIKLQKGPLLRSPRIISTLIELRHISQPKLIKYEPCQV